MGTPPGGGGGFRSNCVWNSLVFSYLASHSEWCCLHCLSFSGDEKLKNIHVDLALLV